MGYWDVLQSEAVTNLCTNPSAETSTTGYVAIGAASAAQNVAAQFSGIYGVRIGSTSSTDGVDAPAATVGAYYAVSAYVYSSFDIDVSLYDSTAGTAAAVETLAFSGSNEWKRVTAIYNDGPKTINLRFERAANGDGSYFIDCVMYNDITADQYTAGLDDWKYFDGDSENCRWLGVPHASQSYSPRTNRGVGVWRSLDDFEVHVIQPSGIGMPPLNLNSQPRALIDGSLYTGQRINPRVITLSSNIDGDTRADLHANRAAFIDLVKNDRTPNNQPFWFRYSGAAVPKTISAVYRDGLDVSQFDGFNEDAALTFVCHDPAWHVDGVQVDVIDTGQQLDVNDYYAVRDMANDDLVASPVWQTENVLSSNLFAFGEALGSIYAAGHFTSIDGDTDYIYIAKFKPSLEPFPAVLDSVVRSITSAPNGNLIIAGGFTTIDAVEFDLIAEYDGDTFTKLDQGLDAGVCMSVVYGVGNQYGDYHLFASGTFTAASGDTDAAYIARWDGAAWNSIGAVTSGGTGIYSVSDGSRVIFYGDITSVNGDTDLNSAVEYSGTTGTFTPFGYFNDDIDGAFIASNGDVYFGGDFTSIDGDTDLAYCVKWNGLRYETIGSFEWAASTPAIYDFAEDDEGLIWISGRFNFVNGLFVSQGLCIYNGYTIVSADVLFPTVLPVSTMFYSDTYKLLFACYSSTGTGENSLTTPVNNIGSMSVRPELVMTRSGGTTDTVVLRWFENLSTSTRLYVDTPIADGETITINFDKGTYTSSLRGNILSDIMRGSSFTTFELIPGYNVLNCFAQYGTATIDAYLTYTPRYWSAD